ncbi:MAG: hypothetical protein WAU45_04920 [Blastocatellia bacterium]
MWKHEQAYSITWAMASRVMEQMGVAVVAAILEIKLDRDTSAEICDVIERRWSAIRIPGHTAK